MSHLSIVQSGIPVGMVRLQDGRIVAFDQAFKFQSTPQVEEHRLFGADFFDAFDPCSLLARGSAERAICEIVGGTIFGGDDAGGGCPAGFGSVGDGGCVPLDQSCEGGKVRDAAGVCRDVTPEFDTPAELGESMHANGHRDTRPAMRDVRTRRCRSGSVLGKDGWCHPKGSIPNKDRRWPKGRRPLGTPGELACVAKASRFAARLTTQKKRFKKMERAFARLS